jgi:hypothetical protein
MLEIIDKIPQNNLPPHFFEDLYFSTNYDNISVSKPSYEKACVFCVGEVFHEEPFACHQFWPWHYYKDSECELLMNLQGEIE